MKKILIISPYFPFPPRDGGKVRLYNLIKHLSSLNEVYLLAYIEPGARTDSVDMARQYCKQVFPVLRQEEKRIISKDIPRCVSFFYTQAMIDELKRVLDIVKPDIVQLDFLIMTQYVKHIEGVPVIYTEHDMSILDFNQSFHDRDLDDKERFGYWKQLVEYEKDILNKFKSVIVLTHRDKKLIENFNNNIKANIIPTGVDIELFKQQNVDNTEQSLVFVGHYRHYPNADAIIYFVNKIFNKILDKLPKLKLYIVGSGVTKNIEELAKNNKNIIITGEVEDVSVYLQKPNIFVAPVRLGGGIKGKVLEAMACGIPVVATKEAIDGIDYDTSDCSLICNDENDFVNNIVALTENKSLYEKLAYNSRKLVENYYDWKKIASSLNDFYSKVIENK